MRWSSLALELRDDGFALEHMDLGGGLGIPYEGRAMVTPPEYARAVIPELRRAGTPVVLEPGRAVVGQSGALVARIVDTKRYPDGRQFAVLDAGMTELMRPALYGSYHRIVPVQPRQTAESSWDVVGPICESSDVFARDRDAAVGAGGRSARRARHRRLRCGHGVQLQSPHARARSARRRRSRGASSAVVRRSTMSLRSNRDQGTAHRIRRAGPERQADAGRAPA